MTLCKHSFIRYTDKVEKVLSFFFISTYNLSFYVYMHVDVTPIIYPHQI